MSIEITRRDFLKTAATTAAIAVAGPGQLILPAALNFCRVYDWLTGTPLAWTRQPQFMHLKKAALAAA